GVAEPPFTVKEESESHLLSGALGAAGVPEAVRGLRLRDRALQDERVAAGPDVAQRHRRLGRRGWAAKGSERAEQQHGPAPNPEPGALGAAGRVVALARPVDDGTPSNRPVHDRAGLVVLAREKERACFFRNDRRADAGAPSG